MAGQARSGQEPFEFIYREDLRSLPDAALAHEVKLHGGFAVDKRPGHGEVYYGMPGAGVMRISADMTTQEIIEVSADLVDVNFHSAKIGEFDGEPRLFLPANGDEMVAVLTLDGETEFILPTPEFEQYADSSEAPYRPTDTVPDGDSLLIADGYGANYITTAHLASRGWTSIFGGKSDDPTQLGKYGTAHGMNRTPGGGHLAIADRPHSRIEVVTFDGQGSKSYGLPDGSRPCGIDFVEWDGHWYAAIGSLDDPQAGRPAPIYILDGESYEVLSTIRPKEDLGIELADHMHNVTWNVHDGRLHLVCQAWNPGYYFVLELSS